MSESTRYLESLCDRLRGRYTVAINDGAGPIDGKDHFTRDFPVSPIQHESAAAIESLRIALADAIRRPMGVIPASADGLLTQSELDAAEARRAGGGK